VGTDPHDEPAPIPVVPLAKANGQREAWDRPRYVIYLWAIVELLLVTNSWQISSKLRVLVLRKFGAQIGSGVTFRPRTRVKFPWKLEIGRDCWIGEGVWIHNQDFVTIGHDVVVSQEAFITTGSHAHRRDMSLLTGRVTIEPGAWVTSRAVVLGNTTIGRSAVIAPASVVKGSIPAGKVYAGNPAREVGDRF
jgi:putative colanic acid biosynthesis acetyltransferase WcaF